MTMQFKITMDGEVYKPERFELTIIDEESRAYVSNALSQKEISTYTFKGVFDILRYKIDSMAEAAEPLVLQSKKLKKELAIKRLREIADSMESDINSS